MKLIVAAQIKLNRLSERLRPRQLWTRLMRGQTMTEYALILAAIAIVVYLTYQTIGTDINALLNKIAADLTPAPSGQ